MAADYIGAPGGINTYNMRIWKWRRSPGGNNPAQAKPNPSGRGGSLRGRRTNAREQAGSVIISRITMCRDYACGADSRNLMRRTVGLSNAGGSGSGRASQRGAAC